MKNFGLHSPICCWVGVIALAVLLIGEAKAVGKEEVQKTKQKTEKILFELESNGTLFSVRKFFSKTEDRNMERLLIIRNDKAIRNIEHYRFLIPSRPTWNLSYTLSKEIEKRKFPIDILGDGGNYLLVITWSGGTHCCYSTYVFDVDAPERVIDLSYVIKEENSTEPAFRDLDDDPALEMKMYDDHYLYWLGSYASSPRPRVVLDFKDGKYQLSAALMKKAPAPEEDITAKALEVKNFKGTPNRTYTQQEVASYMLDLIYSGNAEQAYAFLNKIPDVDERVKSQFKCKFENKLRGSPLWKDIQSFNPFLLTVENLTVCFH